MTFPVTRAEGSAVQSGDDGTRRQGAEARGRATSVPNALPSPVPLHSADLVPVTQGDQMAGYLAAFERAARWFDRIQAGESVLHTPPATMAAARERHHAAAGHFPGWLPRGVRLVYGYLHLGVKGALHLIDWVLESPPRLIVTLAAVAALWYGSS